ncbi:MAG: DnaD domain protein [Oscillospiraceae bacterium]|nr:DnaD domain protein [Oscillospiraceae bacterium]
MSVLKIKLPASRDVLIPAAAANLLFDSGDGNAALLYIYILSHSGELDISRAASRLSVSEDAVLSALDTLKKVGLCDGDVAPPIPDRGDTIPEYSQSDVAEFLGSDAEFKALVSFCEDKLGKILSTVDLQTLLGIYSWLGLPVDVICLLVTSCIEQTRKKFGPGRCPTMRTIEKAAKLWAREGIFTAGRAEEYLSEQEKLGSDKMRLASLLGLQKRSLAPTEDRHISEWLRYEFSDELILLAYDKTVTNTGSLKWRYMDKILTTWYELGIKTVEDVSKKEKSEIPTGSPKLDTDAAERLRELNRKKRLGRE